MKGSLAKQIDARQAPSLTGSACPSQYRRGAQGRTKMLDTLVMGFGALSVCLFAAHAYDFFQDFFATKRRVVN
jgi:hypothetical protein